MAGNLFLQKILRAYFPGYSSKHALPLKHLKAAHALMSCRTKDQGHSLYVCPDDNTELQINHSCRHRSCPACAARKQTQWLTQQQQKLLPCAHYHMVFTLPHEYQLLWQYNAAWFSKTLFRACQETLLELLGDPKYLGVQPGIIMALHTWGRQLNLHPHLHCLVTAGGMDKQEKWKSVADEFMLPIRVVKAVYRGKVQAMIKQALNEQGLVLPPGQSVSQVMQIVQPLYKKSWSVRIQPPYSYGEGVIHYLARYLSGGPLKAQQLIHADHRQIVFRYHDHRTGQTKSFRLSKDEFLRRIFLHVPEPGQHTVRHYGLYSAASKAVESAKAQLEDALGMTNSENKTLAKREEKPVECPCCGVVMELVFQVYKSLKKGNSYIKSMTPKHRARFVQHTVQADAITAVPP